jgi:hypothetical protein
MAAERSTRRYCSEACKQRAKRARERELATLENGELPCLMCGAPMPGAHEIISRKFGYRPPRRYCGSECRQRARNYRRQLARYRVGQPDQDRPYRVGSEPGVVIVTLSVMPTESSFLRLQKLAQKRGPNRVILHYPDGSAVLSEASALTAKDEWRIVIALSEVAVTGTGARI